MKKRKSAGSSEPTAPAEATETKEPAPVGEEAPVTADASAMEDAPASDRDSAAPEGADEDEPVTEPWPGARAAKDPASEGSGHAFVETGASDRTAAVDAAHPATGEDAAADVEVRVREAVREDDAATDGDAPIDGDDPRAAREGSGDEASAHDASGHEASRDGAPGDGAVDADAVELADGEAPADDAAAGDTGDDDVMLPSDASRIESIVESLLFAADRPLSVADLKRLLGERDGARISGALEALRARRADSGIQLVSVAGGWQLRTHPTNGAWVAKLVAGRPQRLSRAMMETLAIVAYRQPITRPEIDEIRGVDCGPVLRTLLDRALVRVIGKKEEVGRPMLYGTTPEFLKTFSLRDLTELPTLREFHELGAAERAELDAAMPVPGSAAARAAANEAGGFLPGEGPMRPSTAELSNVDPHEEEALLDELDQATQAATRATASATEPRPAEGEGAGSPGASAAPATGEG